MNLIRWITLLASLAGTAAAPSDASQAGFGKPVGDPAGNQAQIRFTYQNPQIQPAKYVLLLEENGQGHYRSETTSGGGAAELAAGGEDREIQVSSKTREKIFLAARRSKYFAAPCEAAGEKVAFQGTKTLEYMGADGRGTCTYNWTKDTKIQYLTETFEGISFTLEEGARLELEYRHGRLALDDELETLQEMASQRRALELENIAPVLQQIASDDAVLQRAQRRARSLLAISGAE